MADFIDLVRRNRNYRYTWAGQVVSEIGDHFNNVAILSLVMQTSGSGLVVSGVMLSRAIPAMLAGPVAGVALDRMDRKRIMIASDLVRAGVALAFLLTVRHPAAWLLYLLSAMLMFASPFFTSGRAAILPAITTPADLHTANSLTQTTQWATQTVGALAAGFTAAKLGFEWVFVLNSLSFVFSAACVGMLRGEFRARREEDKARSAVRPWHEYAEGLAYIRSVSLITGIVMLSIGWAVGGGAAQVLFALFGEKVFHRGAVGIGSLWSLAGLGLLAGGAVGHLAGRRGGFAEYKRNVALAYLSHGATYIAFSLTASYPGALMMLALSRVGMAAATVLNFTQLLRHTADQFRGRVFATLESMRWAVMLLSTAAAGLASEFLSPQAIGTLAGLFGCLTGIAWAFADWRGWLPEPGKG